MPLPKRGDEIFIPNTDSRAEVIEIRWLSIKKCHSIEVQWYHEDGGKIGRSKFFDYQEGLEWFHSKPDGKK